MSTANNSAEIVDMADARARLSADAGSFADVGARMAAAREARGVTLAEAAARTHIKENHLVAIETLNVAGLPARPYALGFVRTYAEFLGLDARQSVEQFKFDAGYDSPPVIEAEKFEPADTVTDEGGREMSLLVFAAVLAFIIWSAWQITLTSTVTPIGGEAPAPPALETPAPTPPLSEIRNAVILERIEPVYPHSCAAGAQPVETVTLAFTVTPSGRISGERVAATTNACFDSAALNALRRWRFEPKTVDGTPRPAHDQVQIFRFDRP